MKTRFSWKATGSTFRVSLLVGLIVAALGISQAAFAGTFSGETAWSSGGNFYYQVNYTGTFSHFEVFLDTDNNVSTGYGWYGVIGADYSIQDTAVDKSTGTGWSWTSVGTATETISGTTITVSCPLTDIGSPASAKVGCQALDSNWNATPDTNYVEYYASTSGASYYVSTSGSDTSGTGSLSSPWATPQHAANVATAGSTVYIEAGSYAPFTVENSGSSSGGYITFTNYNGGDAVIDGDLNGTATTGNYSWGLIQLTDKSYITINGLEIRNGIGTATSWPCGIFVGSSGSHINITNNYIHNIDSYEVYDNGGASGNAHGILVSGYSSSADIDNVTISGNTLENIKVGSSECITMDGDTTTWTITDNTIDNVDGIGIDVKGFYSTSPIYDQARYGTESGNTVIDCTTTTNPITEYAPECAGLYVDGGTEIVLCDNSVTGCDIGIQAASEESGHVTSYVTAYNNLLYENNERGIGFGGWEASTSDGGTSNCTFVNNTLYDNCTDTTYADYFGEIGCGWRATGNIVENNIVYANSQDVFFRDYATDGDNPGTVDYNDYYSTAGSSSAIWQWHGGSYSYGLSSWQSTSGEDAHSVFGNPNFVSTSTPNFDIQSGSAAINVGNYSLGSSDYGTTDYAGEARTISGTIDAGAYEPVLSSSGIIANGTYTLTPESAASAGLCLNVYGYWAGAGAEVGLWANVASSNEEWVFTNKGGNNYEISPSYETGYCLEAPGASNGTLLTIAAYTGASNELWTATAVSGGYMFSPTNAPGYNLDDYGWTSGTLCGIWASNGSVENQTWSL
jgi:hypothetical protein